ncbi:hypothetical protein [Streptosporangium roseum]|uniref:hypothetical protein n=1 Tax=Streptosporangium roseum TaxID=2001 RepID=UPI0012DCB894|nr:hypothetical protein [Streptosporangium roseum]
MRVLRPRSPVDEPSPAAEAARAELLEGGDFDRWMTAARGKLGAGAARDEVVILAAELARRGALDHGGRLAAG